MIYIDNIQNEAGATGLSRFTQELNQELSKKEDVVFFGCRDSTSQLDDVRMAFSRRELYYLNIFAPRLLSWYYRYFFRKSSRVYIHDVVRFPGNFRRKTVVVVHDVASVIYPDLYPWIGSFAKRRALKRLSNSRTKIHAVSLLTKSDLLSVSSFDPNRIVVIREGSSSFSVRTEQENCDIGFKALFVGGDHPRKRLKEGILSFNKYL